MSDTLPSLQALIAGAKLAGSVGVWLLNRAEPHIEYVGLPSAAENDAELDREIRALDLHDAEQLLLIRFAQAHPALPDGLTTFQGLQGMCRVCGCTQERACETEEGPCSWVEADLCSACVGRSEAPGAEQPDIAAGPLIIDLRAIANSRVRLCYEGQLYAMHVIGHEALTPDGPHSLVARLLPSGGADAADPR